MDQRGRQVPDGDAGDPALGLGGLARIADDERIEDRQRPHYGLRKAGRAQRHCLAGQPFERAVRPHVNDGVDPVSVLQPEPEGEERMTRRQGGIVIVGAAIARAPAIGRQRHRDVAEALRTKSERAIRRIRIGRGLAPGRVDARGDLGRQLRQ